MRNYENFDESTGNFHKRGHSTFDLNDNKEEDESLMKASQSLDRFPARPLDESPRTIQLNTQEVNDYDFGIN